MEFVEGTDLARYVEKKGPLPVAHACHFIRQAALGLQHAHERGMVHRDIKPHNLMLTAQGVVKVMDFGLARLAREEAGGAGLTGENVLMGTADYIAPEQAEDAHRADIRADIYSLGCSLYHLLAGKAAVRGRHGGAEDHGPRDRGSAAGRIARDRAGRAARRCWRRWWQKNPAQRYQTPGEVAQALAPFVKKAAGDRSRPPVAGVRPRRADDGEESHRDRPAGEAASAQAAGAGRCRFGSAWASSRCCWSAPSSC